MQTGGTKMVKKIRRTIIILMLVFLLIYFLIMPIVNWNRTYDITETTSPEKAIEYYFTAIDERNPKKVLAIYPSLNEYDIKPKMFDYADIINCKINEIKEYSDCSLDYNEKEYIVDFECKGFLDYFKSLSSQESIPCVFHVKKDNEKGNWYITYSHSNA